MSSYHTQLDIAATAKTVPRRDSVNQASASPSCLAGNSNSQTQVSQHAPKLCELSNSMNRQQHQKISIEVSDAGEVTHTTQPPPKNIGTGHLLQGIGKSNTTLEALFSRPGTLMNRMQRRSIAVTLATAMLLVEPSSWSSGVWQKADIALRKTDIVGTDVFLAPYVSQTFPRRDINLT